MPLYAIQFTAPAAVAPRVFLISLHTNVYPDFWCSLVTKCDAPVFTKVCVSGGEAFLNDPNRMCTVGVQNRHWTALKALFR